MPHIVGTDPLGRPISRWVSKHSAAAQPSRRAVRKAEARKRWLAMAPGETVIPVKDPVRYLNPRHRRVVA